MITVSCSSDMLTEDVTQQRTVSKETGSPSGPVSPTLEPEPEPGAVSCQWAETIRVLGRCQGLSLFINTLWHRGIVGVKCSWGNLIHSENKLGSSRVEQKNRGKKRVQGHNKDQSHQSDQEHLTRQYRHSPHSHCFTINSVKSEFKVYFSCFNLLRCLI